MSARDGYKKLQKRGKNVKKIFVFVLNDYKNVTHVSASILTN